MRISEQIKDILSNIFITEPIFINYVMVSIVSIDVSSDLRNAKVYLSLFKNEDSFDAKTSFKEIMKNKHILKYKLGLRLKTKYVPSVKFFLSDEYQYYDNINQLTKKK